MRQMSVVSAINLNLDQETHRAAKAKAALEGIGFYQWCVRAIKRAAEAESPGPVMCDGVVYDWNPGVFQCRKCGKVWTQNESAPICKPNPRVK